MKKVKLTVISSRCRCQYHKAGDEFTAGDICPPVCAELWHRAYPYVFALQNGAVLDSGDSKTFSFTVCCPDEGRVCLKGELFEEQSVV